ncbi:MAG: PadR family transcriptional regulator [Oscillospiraceae bacterium]|jgi:PadR family transcriptional regulator PadR|nr:PadR family transcriptional regulator [Oscillospiraceae bacterium]
MDSKQLKKGVLDILLLKLLSEGTLYGYELMELLGEAGGGSFAAKEGTLSPVLYRLEDAGYIKSVWENTDTRRGAPRKYYTATDRGRERLAGALRELDEFIHAVTNILGGKFHESN